MFQQRHCRLHRRDGLAPVLGDVVLEPLLGVSAQVVDLVDDGGRVALLQPDEVVAVVVVHLPNRLRSRVPTHSRHFAFKRNLILDEM